MKAQGTNIEGKVTKDEILGNIAVMLRTNAQENQVERNCRAKGGTSAKTVIARFQECFLYK